MRRPPSPRRCDRHRRAWSARRRRWCRWLRGWHGRRRDRARGGSCRSVTTTSGWRLSPGGDALLEVPGLPHHGHVLVAFERPREALADEARGRQPVSTVVPMGSVSFVGCGHRRSQDDGGSAVGSGGDVQFGADSLGALAHGLETPVVSRGPALPTPSSRTSRLSREPSDSSVTHRLSARACLRTLPMASWATRSTSVAVRAASGGPDSARERCTRRPVAWPTSRA